MPPTEGHSSARPRVSLTMIVRDEEQNLAGCLESVADLVDEIVVADTGSVDRTREIASHYGARVVDVPWVDHFAEARNAALRQASGDWIFWLDADDRLDAENRGSLQRLFDSLGDEHAAYIMRQSNTVEAAPGQTIAFDRVHLWRRHPDVRWERRVHEQVLPALQRSGALIRRTGVTFRHVGYHEAATHRRKAERNLRLLELEAAESPDDPFTLFNLAWSFHGLGRAEEAVGVMARCAAIAPPGISYRRKLHALWARSLHGLGRREEALEVCRAGRRDFPDDAELTFLEALMLRERGDLAGSEALLRRLVAAPDEATLAACADLDLKPIKARNQLAEILRLHRPGCRGGGPLAGHRPGAARLRPLLVRSGHDLPAARPPGCRPRGPGTAGHPPTPRPRAGRPDPIAARPCSVDHHGRRPRPRPRARPARVGRSPREVTGFEGRSGPSRRAGSTRPAVPARGDHGDRPRRPPLRRGRRRGRDRARCRPPAAGGAISRHLAPGGVARVSTPNREGAWARRLGANNPMWLETEHLHDVSRRSLARLLSDAGLVVTSYRLSPRYEGGSESIVERMPG